MRLSVWEVDIPGCERLSDESLHYIAASRLAVENSRILSTDSILPQDPAFTGIFQWRRGRDSNPRRAFDLQEDP